MSRSRKIFSFKAEVYFEYDSGTQPTVEHLTEELDQVIQRTFFRARTTRPKVVLLGQKSDEVVPTGRLGE